MICMKILKIMNFSTGEKRELELIPFYEMKIMRWSRYILSPLHPEMFTRFSNLKTGASGRFCRSERR